MTKVVRASVALLAAAVTGVVWYSTAQPSDSFSHALGLYGPDTLLVNLAASYGIACLAYLALGSGRARVRAARLGLLTGSLTLVAAILELPALSGAYDYRVLFYPRIPGSLGPHNRVYKPGMAFSRPAGDTFESTQPGAASILYGLDTDRRYRARHRYDARGYRNSRDIEAPDVVRTLGAVCQPHAPFLPAMRAER